MIRNTFSRFFLGAFLFYASRAAGQPAPGPYALALDTLNRRAVTDIGPGMGDGAYVYIDRQPVLHPTGLSARRTYVDYLEGAWADSCTPAVRLFYRDVFAGSRGCYRLVDSKTKVSFGKRKYCPVAGKPLPLLRYRFTALRYTAGGAKAVIFARQAWGWGAGHAWLWTVVLQRQDNRWQVTQVSGKPE